MWIFHGKQREQKKQEELITLEGNEKVKEIPIDETLAPDATQNPNADETNTALKKENMNSEGKWRTTKIKTHGSSESTGRIAEKYSRPEKQS
ncbi:hypothetical protein NPIL_620421 [Nephila pilipes]|uniref:Uncharacterized protein n=1 Tax=Nephila pilipes TaxID=299642 RepID=A0A8X6MPU4_NEPPI|nr:hypothetical protein NPIL_620421 [Nephila pilipes]